MIWSFTLAAIGVLALHLIGRKRRLGFALGACSQVLWIIYAVVTAQYGFIFAAFFYGQAYVSGYRRWGKEEADG